MDRSPATGRVGRRLTLGDVMLLVVGTGLGLAVCQWVIRDLIDGLIYLFRSTRPSSAALTILRAANLAALALTVFGGWTIVLPLLRLRRPRPSWPRLVRQPGLTACLAATAGMGLGALATGAAYGLGWMLDGSVRLAWFVWLNRFLREMIIPSAGTAVASVWAVQAISGRWRPVPDAIDRFGRALGALWLLAGLAWALRQFIELY